MQVGNHTGGYDAFWFDITDFLAPTDNELILGVFDPSDSGTQPFGSRRVVRVGPYDDAAGKQSISRIYSPGGGLRHGPPRAP